jgi:aminoglycoside 3-N-acetyltransferase
MTHGELATGGSCAAAGPGSRAARPGHDRLAADLLALGVPAGRDLLVHCSLRRVGPAAGGPAALLAALRRVAGPAATLVVPTGSAGNSTTSRAFRAATAHLGPTALAEYEARMPGFDRLTTPSQGMGAFAEHVRRQPGARRSGHPQTSFAALGPRALEVTAVHDLDCHLGPRSPLGHLYTAGAAILLLGVGYQACTALHLAEYAAPRRPPRDYRCYLLSDGRRVRRDFVAPDLDDSDFAEIGAAFDERFRPPSALVGAAPARLLDLRTLVDFATTWMGGHRRPRAV